MTLPDEKEWERAMELAAELEVLSPAQQVIRVRELEAAGESPKILNILREYLEVPPPPPPFSIGDVVAGRFELLELIGDGGMGSVWRAKQISLGRDVALKMIYPTLVSPAMVKRLDLEKRILCALKHPGIVEIYDADVARTKEGLEAPFFVMSWRTAGLFWSGRKSTVAIEKSCSG